MKMSVSLWRVKVTVMDSGVLVIVSRLSREYRAAAVSAAINDSLVLMSMSDVKT